MKTTSRQDAPIERIADTRQPFKTFGAFWGFPHNPDCSLYNFGWLDSADRRAWEAERAHSNYTIVSYYTPIAWHVAEHQQGDVTIPSHWTVAGRSYSTSTGKHQSTLWKLNKGSEPVVRLPHTRRLSDRQYEAIHSAVARFTQLGEASLLSEYRAATVNALVGQGLIALVGGVIGRGYIPTALAILTLDPPNPATPEMRALAYREFVLSQLGAAPAIKKLEASA